MVICWWLWANPTRFKQHRVLRLCLYWECCCRQQTILWVSGAIIPHYQHSTQHIHKKSWVSWTELYIYFCACSPAMPLVNKRTKYSVFPANGPTRDQHNAAHIIFGATRTVCSAAHRGAHKMLTQTFVFIFISIRSAAAAVPIFRLQSNK